MPLKLYRLKAVVFTLGLENKGHPSWYKLIALVFLSMWKWISSGIGTPSFRHFSAYFFRTFWMQSSDNPCLMPWVTA